jgi:hypothetical protein
MMALSLTTNHAMAPSDSTHARITSTGRSPRNATVYTIVPITSMKMPSVRAMSAISRFE